jgi:hypothetical protein
VYNFSLMLCIFSNVFIVCLLQEKCQAEEESVMMRRSPMKN